jgi:ribose 5-phosphate isomerase B
MQILLAADHAGFKLKESIKKELSKKHDIIDVSPKLVAGDDYPKVAKQLVKRLQSIERDPETSSGLTIRGVFVCGSGVGASIAANRYKGIRAAQGYDKKEVKLARQDTDINVLTLSGWNTKLKDALALIDVYLKTPASKASRHKRRIKQLS